jgi:hypothetical protein
MNVEHLDDRVVIHAHAYRLEVNRAQPMARLFTPGASRPMPLMLLTSVDSDRGYDGTLAVGEPDVEHADGAVTITIAVESTAWTAKRHRIVCRDAEIELTAQVVGDGQIGEVRLFGGRYTGNPRWGGGMFYSSLPLRTMFDPSPDDPRRVLAPAAEPASIGVIGSSQPGRGHWFFTPAPFLFAGTEAEITDPDDPSGAPWTVLELRAGIDQATFTELRHAPFLGGFSLLLGYDGETATGGTFRTPPVVIRPGIADPYAAVADHAARLRAEGLAPTVERTRPGWWTRPIFCGWGEQNRAASGEGLHPTTLSRRDRYDAWLGILARHGIRPGTITIDDKWQRTYGRNEPDDERWPDLRGWIADRHADDQRVLLWFKAWDPEGLPPEACITDRLNHRVAVDPESPAYQAILRESLTALLSPGGLDADGLKVDFTAQTPSGPGLDHAGPGWGVALLHRLLGLVYRYAKDAKPDALIVTHTPNPLFADVTDMIRLNDLMRLDDPDPFVHAVPQMRHRARIAAAVEPGWLIDTDDWCMPSRAEWRAYLEVKPDLGVPALYYATGIDHSDEAFTDDDYAAICAAWARWEARPVQEADR